MYMSAEEAFLCFSPSLLAPHAQTKVASPHPKMYDSKSSILLEFRCVSASLGSKDSVLALEEIYTSLKYTFECQ